MQDITIKIDAGELALAIAKLADALHGKNPTAPSRVPDPVPASAVSALTTAAPTPVPNPVPMTVAPTVSAVPVSVPVTAPTYTIDQITKAGADLVQAGKMPQLYGLMQQFQINAATDLRPDQYGAFATALREMGAQI